MKEPSEELLLKLPLLVRELWSGDHLAFPVASSKLAAFGSRAEIIEELRLFLKEHLSRISATQVSTFTMPEEISLRRFEIEVPREDLPKRLPIGEKISFTAIIIPANSDVWVIVPKLDHTFYVERGEELEEAVRNEVRRMAAARELKPGAYLHLFPAREEQLEFTTVEVERIERAPHGQIANLEKEIVERKKKKLAVEVLESVAQPLHARAEAHQGPDLLAREAELASLSSLLNAKQRSSVLLVGGEMIGKTALFLAWLRAEKKAGRFRPVYSTSGAQLIAGMSGLGQWQERVKRVMEAAELLDAIIYFDNLGDLFGDRMSSNMDLAGAMKSWVGEGRVRIVGEMTPEALDLFESRHVGFFSAFARIRLGPLDVKTTTAALHQRIAFDTEHEPDRPIVQVEAVTTLMDLVERYHPYRPFPGKAMRFYEELRTICEKDRNRTGRVEPVTSDRVLEAFSMQSGIPAFLLREDRALHKDAVLEIFKKKLIGQERAIERVVDTICVVKAQLQPAGKPLATFMFVGPTGVGKTELARTLASFLFGSADRMVRFDMSELSDPYAAERLIRGTERSEGLLTRRVRQQPFSVLLLDEIEKAHSSVFDLLLQVFGEGRLTDTRGRTAYFHNTIIIMTSNLGAAHRKSTVGIDPGNKTREEHYLREVNLAFRPELVNRLDRVIAFSELSEAEVEKVARIALEKVRIRRGLLDGGITLHVTEAALALLARDGYSEAYGARALRRHMEDELVAPASRLIGRSGGEARGATLIARAANEAPVELEGLAQSIGSEKRGELHLELRRPKAERARRDQIGVTEAFGLRRIANQHLTLERVRQVKDQITFLLSQMAYGAHQTDQRSAKEIAELQTEHYRLSQVYSKLDAAMGDLLAAEELALVALFENEDTREYVSEVARAFDNFQHALVYVLVGMEPLRDEITFRASERDQGRGFDYWLVPLLEDARRREWTVQVHFQHEKAGPGEAWPPERRFGPPRNDRAALEQLAEGSKKARHVLVRVKGPYAGVLLSLEAGLHRYIETHAHVDPAHLSISPLAMRYQLSDQEWLTDLVASPLVDAVDLSRQRAVREWHGRYKKLSINDGDKRAFVLDDYWKRFEELAIVQLLGYENAGGREGIFTDLLATRYAKKEDEEEES